jgi:hypothetical protein
MSAQQNYIDREEKDNSNKSKSMQQGTQDNLTTNKTEQGDQNMNLYVYV